MRSGESVLEPRRASLALPMALAVVGHAVFLGGMLVATSLSPRKPAPLIDVMEVSMVVKPRSQSRMPEKATRAPVPQGSTPAPQPTEAPPPNPSDLVVSKPDAPEAQGAPDRSAERAAALRKLMMEQLVSDANAPVGERDRQATDPDSETDESIDAAGIGARGDPEIARYEAKIQALFKAHFRPLPTVTAANPDIVAVVRLEVDLETGRILGYEVSDSSGNPSYDAAAERAVAAVREIPPPPERFAARYRNGYGIKFVPP